MSEEGNITQPPAPQSAPVPPEPAQPAPAPAPEPQAASTGPGAYQSIIQQQQEQIDALIAHNKSLSDQITALVHNGGQITDPDGQPGDRAGAQSQPQPQQAQPAFTGMPGSRSIALDEDMSLEALAKEIGKREQ